MKHLIFYAAAFALLIAASEASAAPPGWRLVWSDDFESLDEQKWQLTDSVAQSHGSQQAFAPGQVSAADGSLVIRAEKQPAGTLAYRSGEAASRHVRRYGRWEVRAQIPAGRGLWSSIRLVPADDAPSRPEADHYQIVVMENFGDRPTLTRSSCHWGPRPRSTENSIVLVQQTSLVGNLVNYAEGFHIYAVEWLADQIRFYVDDVHLGTLYGDEVGDFMSRPAPPMRLVIGAAVGGELSPPPDETTTWPQRLLVDWVRVYEEDPKGAVIEFSNGDFEASGGTMAGWHAFGNRAVGQPNVLVHTEAAHAGKTALKLSGQSSGGMNYSGASQGITVAGGEQVRAKLSVMSRSKGGLAGTRNRAMMKIEFYKRFGDYFGGPNMVGVEEQVIADASTAGDVWSERELVARAPEGAVEARL